MNNIAIITARSGSKGLKDKNIKLLDGKPLLAYSIKAALESKMFTEVMVSTDSREYSTIAQQYGAKVPFFRSKRNSGDNAGSWDVIKEVLEKYKEKEVRFDTVCLLQPTSPLRSKTDIIKGYDLLKTKEANAVTAVCEVEHSPLWTMTLDDSLSLEEYKKKTENQRNIPRQQLPQYYRVNGALYIRKIKYAGNQIDILDNNEVAYIMEQSRSIDIDTELDFRMAELVMTGWMKKS